MDFLTGALGLVFGFSILIFVHELGHYLLAKWNGVRVYVFSLGMGPYVFSFTWGETLYVFSLIPIGGYVKMAGQDDLRPSLPVEKDPHDYRNKRPGQKAAILAAGAFFNLVFALFAFTACYYFGVEMQAPVIGNVRKGSPLDKAESLTASGKPRPNPLKKGDRITMINGVHIKTFMEAKMEIASAGPDAKVWINYERKGQPVLDPAVVVTRRSASLGAATVELRPYGKEESFHLGFTTKKYIFSLGTPDAKTPAGKAGIQDGDKIISVDGKVIKDDTQMIELVQDAKGGEQVLQLEREGKQVEVKLSAKENDEGVYLLGVPLGEAELVTHIDEACEAHAAGVREGSFIRALKKLRNNTDLELTFSDRPDDKGTDRTCVVPIDTKSKSLLEYTTEVPMMELMKEDSFVEALSVAWGDVIRHSKTVFTIVRGLLSGAVSTKAVSGPLGIGRFMTLVAVESSFMYYFWFLAFLSVNLGVIQFLPIPILDGWHLVMITVEKLKGSPVAPRVEAAFQYAGLFLILALMLLATSNDIMRFLQ